MMKYFLIFLSVSITFGKKIFVPSVVKSIQEALYIASPNDTILVFPGRYTENIVWPNKQSLVLISKAGPKSTIIDGSKRGRVITFTGPLDTTTVLKGFTITNGLAKGTGGTGSGGGILCKSKASPLIEGNIIIENESHDDGGGISCMSNSSPVIRNNNIQDNTANDGGGICISHSSPVVTNNDVINNSTRMYGGGICVYGRSSAKLLENLITSNKAGIGGGICLYDSASCEILYNHIIGNASNDGGGIACYYSSSPKIIGNIIEKNRAYWRGGGINCFNGSSPYLYETKILNNVADANGGGISCWRNASPKIVKCEIIENRKNGLHAIENSTPYLDSCTVTGNIPLAIQNDDSLEIKAVHTYWGDNSGPYHPDFNPTGKGDALKGNIFFKPWIVKKP